MKLEPRYHDEPAWDFTWDTGAIKRKIQLNIIETPTFLDLSIHTMAWSEELGIVESHPRSFKIRLPTTESLVWETLDWARGDAEALEVRST